MAKLVVLGQSEQFFVMYAGAQFGISHSGTVRLSNELFPQKNQKEIHMNINLTLAPLVSLLAGILILVMPRLLNFIVAIYLILIGLIGLFGTGKFLS